jgi:hypothetical protein
MNRSRSGQEKTQQFERRGFMKLSMKLSST